MLGATVRLCCFYAGCSGSPAAAEDKHVCGRTPGQKGGRQPPCSRLRSFQLVQPSVTSSMPCGISSYTCTGGKGRRRLFPRLSVEVSQLLFGGPIHPLPEVLHQQGHAWSLMRCGTAGWSLKTRESFMLSGLQVLRAAKLSQLVSGA